MRPEIVPLSKYLVENSNHSRTNIKRRLFDENFFENICSICGLSEIWNGKHIVMRLDHINGIHNDYRIENLRMVCPNCDSQLDTFTGRNARKAKTGRKKYFCNSCGKEVSQGNNCCTKCDRDKRKTFKMEKEKLKNLIWTKPMRKIAIDFGVSDSTIKARCVDSGIKVPPRGYWNNKNIGE